MTKLSLAAALGCLLSLPALAGTAPEPRRDPPAGASAGPDRDTQARTVVLDKTGSRGPDLARYEDLHCAAVGLTPACVSSGPARP